jgi:hypothetical protein
MKRNKENKPHTINKHNMKIMTHFRQLRIKLTRKEKDLKKKNQHFTKHKLFLTNKTTKQVTKSRTKQHSTISDLKTITRNNNNNKIKNKKNQTTNPTSKSKLNLLKKIKNKKSI